MTDIIDTAQAVEQRMRAKGVERARRALSGNGAEDCEDCAEPIPDERRKAMPSARRCATCQEKRERRGRR